MSLVFSGAVSSVSAVAKLLGTDAAGNEIWGGIYDELLGFDEEGNPVIETVYPDGFPDRPEEERVIPADAPAGIADSSADSKYSEELIKKMSEADDSEKIMVLISFTDIDQKVMDAKIRESFSGKYGTLDEYYDYEEVIMPRIIRDAEEEFGKVLAHARIFKDEETGEIFIADFDPYIGTTSELQKIKDITDFDERNAYIHSVFSEEILTKAYESCNKGYSIISGRLSDDIDDYRSALIHSKIELQHKNVSDCLTKYIAEDEIISNAVNMGMAMLTKDQIEEISHDSQVSMMSYFVPATAEPAVDAIIINTGDINFDGKVDVTDLTELSLALLGDTELTSAQQQSADVDGSGDVKLADLATLKQYLSKQIDSFGTVRPAGNESLVNIVDLALRDGMTTSSALEKFYEDDEYTYIFGSIKSKYIECTFKDGSKSDVKTALEKGLVSISDLDAFGISYIKEVKNPEDGIDSGAAV